MQIWQTKDMKMHNIKNIRLSFWDAHPDFKPFYRGYKRQNDYPATIRVAFTDYIDRLQKDGLITEKQAEKATLWIRAD